jgi:hypothetical protein
LGSEGGFRRRDPKRLSFRGQDSVNVTVYEELSNFCWAIGRVDYLPRVKKLLPLAP